MLEEDLERVDEWARSYLARGTALIGTCAAHILLDGVDLGNARDGFGGDGRASPRSAILKNSRRKWLQQKATVILSAGNFL